MGPDSPFRVPGESAPGIREGLVDGATGVYDDLPPGLGPLLEVSAECVARAFDAFARGQLELCNAVLAEGMGAAGEIFAGFVDRVTSPAYPYRVDSPHWVPFLAHLAFMVLDPPPEAPAGPPSPPAEPVSLADEMRAMGLM